MPWTNLAAGTLRALTDATYRTSLSATGEMPQFFMSGDGHRHPPFEWAVGCKPLLAHFQTLMADKKLVLHVEEHQENVTDNSVPMLLQPLVYDKKVFGWELEIYRHLEPIMKLCMDIAGSSLVPAEIADDVARLDRELAKVDGLLWMIGDPPPLKAKFQQMTPFKLYYMNAAKGGARNPGLENNFMRFLIDYNNAAMGMRTTVNNYIGINIQKVIDAHPDSTHLITCGDAHITTNPLSGYIRIPGAALGVVDQNNM